LPGNRLPADSGSPRPARESPLISLSDPRHDMGEVASIEVAEMPREEAP